jgi:hypothetical protein
MGSELRYGAYLKLLCSLADGMAEYSGNAASTVIFGKVEREQWRVT